MSDLVRIGNAGGYWGDDPRALERQVLGPEPPEFVTSDFLAEITMSILRKQRDRNPEAGYARDFVTQVAPLLGALRERAITVITNAGGVNPMGCARAVLARADADVRIAVVDGDDLMDQVPGLVASGFRNLETGAAFAGAAGDVGSANAYLGAEPVVRALAGDPAIVVTGRVTDTGITLAALRHRFGWAADDWDKIAQGVVAGHLIECGAQATGGNFTDWRRVPGLGNLGFPIVEVEPDGDFVATLQPGEGGLVNPAVVREQLLYELGDPAAYLCPDATVDFSGLTAVADGPNRVRISGARGGPPPPDLKVSATVAGGYALRGSLVVGGPDVRAKTAALREAVAGRLAGDPPDELRVDLAGDDAAQRGFASGVEPSEGLVRIAAWSERREPLLALRKLLPALILSGPAGLAVTGGAPPVSEVAAYWPTTVPRSWVTARVRVLGGDEQLVPTSGPAAAPRRRAAAPAATRPFPRSGVPAPLGSIAHARAGDKGDAANVGILARSEAAWEYLAAHLDAATVAGWAEGVANGPVVRYELPGLRALNFVLEGALGGGGTRSLLLDPQGKTLAQGILRRRIPVPPAVLASVPDDERPLSPAWQP